MPSAITLPLQGGLGNQLFELCAGLALGVRTGRRVVFSDDPLRHPAPLETPRQLQVGALLHDDELVHSRVRRHGRAWDRVLHTHVLERDLADDPLRRVTATTRVVAGYLQKLEYVETAWPHLAERMAASSNPVIRRLSAPATGTHGALHYRLGDFANDELAREHHGVSTTHYFAESVRRAHGVTGTTDWQVVSDEPERALRELAACELPEGVRLRPAPRGDEWQDLLVLATARTLVLSNSSFSWWGAWLGQRTSPTHVVAPVPWLASVEQVEPAIFPRTWERVPRS